MQIHTQVLVALVRPVSAGLAVSAVNRVIVAAVAAVAAILAEPERLVLTVKTLAEVPGKSAGLVAQTVPEMRAELAQH